MSERLKHEGLLQEKELTAKSLRLRIAGDVTALRELLDPFVPAEKLKADIIAEQSLEMAKKQIELKQILDEIETIKDFLGR